MKKNWHDLTFLDAPKKDPYDWWPVVPEAHDLSGAAAAHYFGRILRAPVEWMHTPLDVVDVPEADIGIGQVPHEPTPPGERMTYYEMLAQGGREIGETGLLGSEASAEDPWVGQDLTPEILEVLVPLATEIAAYPTGGKVLAEGAMQFVEGAEATLGAAARGYERLAAPIAQAYRKARLPGRLAKSQERLTSLGEEAMRGVEWWKNVNEAEKLNMLDEAERQINHALKWTESTLAAEDDMRMALAMGESPQTPRAPGPGAAPAEGEAFGVDRLGVAGGPRVEGRVEPGFGAMPESTEEVLGRISRGYYEPAPTDPYAYLGEDAARRLEVINQRRRATINSGMNRAKMRATAEQKQLLNELEAAGVDFTEADQVLSVEPDKFGRARLSFEDNMRQGIPPKLVTKIHDKTIPELIGDPRYTAGASSLSKRRAMASALNEGLPKGSPARITAEEIANAGKDPNLREKMAKLMARRIRNKPYYKDKEQGFLEMSLALRLGEMGIGAVTGGAVDEENRLRGAIVGALVAFTLGTVLRYGKGLGEVGAVEAGGRRAMRKMQEKVVRAAEIEGPEVLRKPEHTRAEAKVRGARRELQNKMFGKAMGSKMGRDGLRDWVKDTYGKTLGQMTEAEMVLADQDLTRRIALSRIFPEGQLDNAVKIRNIEDIAMELHGAKAQKRIDAAVRKTVGAHRDLRELNEHELTGVLEVLPKRFLRTRGLGALIRQPLAVEDVMNRMGTWGRYITRQVRRERLHTDYLWSKWFSPLQEEIRGLTSSQMDEVVAALHPMEANARQVVMPRDPRLQSIALRIRQDLNEVGNARMQIGDPVRLADGSTRPFEMMDNYYPLHIAPEEMTSSILIKRRIVEHLMETGQAAGPSEALDIYQRFIQETISNRFGNLDYAREAWIEPEKFDLLKDLSRYYYGSAKRISRHKFYGTTRPGGELPQKMHDWLNGLRQDVGPDEFVFAQKAMKRHFKHEAVDDAMSDMLKRIRSFETVAHMGLAQIMNSSEPVHTAVFAGFHNFAKGFARAIRGTSRMDAREIVARNAAAVGSTIRDLFGEAGGAGSLTSKFLKYSGFSPIEKWNRRLASHVGIQYIESTVQKLIRNPQSARLRYMLDEVLINADDVLRNGLSEEQLIKGAMELSNRTQKRTGVIDMPMFMSHPMGRIVAMFKTFAYGSARLMTRDFLFAARRNPERLLRLLVAFPIVGEIVGDVRNLATGNVRDTEGLARLAENFAYVGTMGILYDFMRSVQFGEGSIQSFMTGPVGSDIAGITAGTYQWLAEGKGRKIGKQALRMLPPPVTLLRGKAGQKALFGKEFFPPPTKTWRIP